MAFQKFSKKSLEILNSGTILSPGKSITQPSLFKAGSSLQYCQKQYCEKNKFQILCTSDIKFHRKEFVMQKRYVKNSLNMHVSNIMHSDCDEISFTEVNLFFFSSQEKEACVLKKVNLCSYVVASDWNVNNIKIFW